ncbi:MAG: heme o synthase [Thermoprotei archaeon]
MSLKDYITLTKPSQTFLLVFTSIMAYYAAPGNKNYLVALLLIISMTLAVSGVTVINMYFDRDIDSIMPRTKRRPIPSGKVSPTNALIFGIILYLLGQILSLGINSLVALTIFLGFFFDIPIYTLLLKRRSTTNIIFGGIAGSMPAMGGWVAQINAIDMRALLISLLVLLWIPMHIWYISTYYLDDYKQANIPMLPVVVGPRKATTGIIISLLLMELDVIIMYMLRMAGLLTVFASTMLIVLSIYKTFMFAQNPTKIEAKKLFKFASPYLAIIFAMIVIENNLLSIKLVMFMFP